jgi:hypothetical protein
MSVFGGEVSVGQGSRLLQGRAGTGTDCGPALLLLLPLLACSPRLVLGGDRSAWDRALLMPHYAAAGMPLLSSRQVGRCCCAAR